MPRHLPGAPDILRMGRGRTSGPRADQAHPRPIGEGAQAGRIPVLARQAANLAGAVGRIVVAVAKGEPIKVPQEVYHERLAICRECEFNTERPFGVPARSADAAG